MPGGMKAMIPAAARVRRRACVGGGSKVRGGGKSSAGARWRKSLKGMEARPRI